MKKNIIIISAICCIIALFAFTSKPSENGCTDQSHKRIVSLCTIEGYGSDKTVSCDEMGAFYYDTDTDWDGNERFLSGYILIIVDGVESSKRFPVYENPYKSGVKGNYKFKAGKYYFN